MSAEETNEQIINRQETAEANSDVAGEREEALSKEEIDKAKEHADHVLSKLSAEAQSTFASLQEEAASLDIQPEQMGSLLSELTDAETELQQAFEQYKDELEAINEQIKNTEDLAREFGIEDTGEIEEMKKQQAEISKKSSKVEGALGVLKETATKAKEASEKGNGEKEKAEQAMKNKENYLSVVQEKGIFDAATVVDAIISLDKEGVVEKRLQDMLADLDATKEQLSDDAKKEVSDINNKFKKSREDIKGQIEALSDKFEESDDLKDKREKLKSLEGKPMYAKISEKIEEKHANELADFVAEEGAELQEQLASLDTEEQGEVLAVLKKDVGPQIAKDVFLDKKNAIDLENLNEVLASKLNIKSKDFTHEKMFNLPPELMQKILDNLSPAEVTRLSRGSSPWKDSPAFLEKKKQMLEETQKDWAPKSSDFGRTTEIPMVQEFFDRGLKEADPRSRRNKGDILTDIRDVEEKIREVTKQINQDIGNQELQQELDSLQEKLQSKKDNFIDSLNNLGQKLADYKVMVGLDDGKFTPVKESRGDVINSDTMSLYQELQRVVEELRNNPNAFSQRLSRELKSNEGQMDSAKQTENEYKNKEAQLGEDNEKIAGFKERQKDLNDTLLASISQIDLGSMENDEANIDDNIRTLQSLAEKQGDVASFTTEFRNFVQARKKELNSSDNNQSSDLNKKALDNILEAEKEFNARLQEVSSSFEPIADTLRNLVSKKQRLDAIRRDDEVRKQQEIARQQAEAAAAAVEAERQARQNEIKERQKQESGAKKQGLVDKCIEAVNTVRNRYTGDYQRISTEIAQLPDKKLALTRVAVSLDNIKFGMFHSKETIQDENGQPLEVNKKNIDALKAQYAGALAEITKKEGPQGALKQELDVVIYNAQSDFDRNTRDLDTSNLTKEDYQDFEKEKQSLRNSLAENL